MRKYSFIYCLLCLSAFACNKAPSFGIDQISWLEGAWRVTDGSGIESWKREGSEMKGNVFNNRKSTYTESLRIHLGIDKNLIYEATVKDQNGGKPISFGLMYRSTDSIQFVNMQHDFPNYIEYKKINDTIVIGHAYGFKGSNDYKYAMVKIK